MREYTLARAALALQPWGGDPATLEPIEAWEHRVFRFSRAGVHYALRLSDPDLRSRPQLEAELAFVRHLEEEAIPVAAPLPSNDGGSIESTADCHATVFSWIEGEAVDWNSPSWEPPFFSAWGAALARLHRAAERYRGPRLEAWRPTTIDARVKALAEPEDGAAREEWSLLRARIDRLARDASNYGLIHGDATPRNFRYRPGHASEVVFFDFGGCGEHWYAMDVAVALLYFRRDRRRDQFRRAFLEGYGSARALSASERDAIGAFLRLRLLEVLLSRREAFGPRPDQRQRAVLSNLRLAVAERFEVALD
ncbi:MAG: phosphotransferase [Candidatus Eisenbacteria bacterium]